MYASRAVYFDVTWQRRWALNASGSPVTREIVSGQVGGGRMMIYSGSARPISTGHDVIYKVTC
jgi:hypothetical protein